jgi:hypothetical protein
LNFDAGEQTMGLFTFESKPASVFWKNIDPIFHTFGKWVDPPGDLAEWWKGAYDELLRKNQNFSKMDHRFYKPEEAARQSSNIVDNLKLLSNPGAVRLSDITGGLINGMTALKEALPPFAMLARDEVGHSFFDRSFTILKHAAAALENQARRQSQDSNVNWQELPQTLALLRFMDTRSVVVPVV